MYSIIHSSESKFKRCVKESYIERAAEELEDDNPSNAVDSDDDDENSGKEDDEKETPGGEENPLKGIPPKKSPSKSKHPIDEKKGDWQPGPDAQKEDKDDDEDNKDDSNDEKKEDEEKEDEEKDDDKDDDDADKQIKQGTSGGISITPPNKGKTKGKKEKSETKST